MSHCACFTLPDGTVGIVRPNPVLVVALLAPTVADAMAFLDHRKQGLAATVVTPLYRAMVARTEQEAVRVVAERDARRLALARGLLPDDAAALTVMEATGLLAPDASRRWRNCWRRAGAGAPAVDMPLARAQRMSEVRRERTARLAASDSAIMTAHEQNDRARTTALTAYRQTLRDLPATTRPTVEACTTPAQLEAWQPTWPVDPTA